MSGWGGVRRLAGAWVGSLALLVACGPTGELAPGVKEVLARGGVSSDEGAREGFAPVGPLLVSDTELYFGRAVVGQPQPAKLALGNTGPALALRFEVSGPFSVDVAERTLGQGERMDLRVSFTPRAVGEATGELRVLGAGEPRRVALGGKAVEACPQSHTSCRSYQVTAGACVLQPMEDGSACGPETCGGRDLCRSARCVREVPPEGAACQTTCGGAGTCHDKRCLPPGGTARELWSHDPGPDRVIRSNVVLDAEGGLYFRECPYDWDEHSPACELVALAANGATRYRIPDPASWCGESLALLGHQLVAGCGTQVTALNAKDGAVLFQRDLTPEVEALFGQRVATTSAWSHDGGQRLFFVLSGKHPDDTERGVVLGLDATTGEPVWRQVHEGGLAGAVSDEQGHLYFSVRPPGAGEAGQWVVSLNGQGQERWRRQTPLATRPYTTERMLDAPRAVSGGTLVLHSLRGLSTVDGSERFLLTKSQPDSYGPSPLVMNAGLGVWRDGTVLKGFDPVSGAARWTYQVPGRVFQGFTLAQSASASTLLLANGPLLPQDYEESYDDVSGHAPALCEVSATGTLKRELSLPGFHLFVGGWLGAGPGRVLLMRWDNWFASNLPAAYQLYLFEVPGLEAASSGWGSEEGGPFGGRRPR